MKPSKPFLQLIAGDLMSRDVITIPRAMSLRTAARLLAGARVTGAPVVDSDGRCVGVISSTDFLRWAGQSEGQVADPNVECVCCAWQIVESGSLPEHQVGELMTPDPVMVTQVTPIYDLARMMLDARIHRIVVIDEQRCPMGVVSTTDILAAVAHAGVRRLAHLEPAGVG